MNISTSLENLKQNGFRITKARIKILEVIKEFSTPISARDIQSKLTFVDRATIYRELSFLTNQGIIREVDLGENKTFYELQDEHCHHHLVCESCGEITAVNLDEEKILSQIPENKGFQIKRHTIEFFGLCSHCH